MPVRLILRLIGFIVMSVVIGFLLWFFSVIPVYGLEGGEDCTYEGNCSPLGDFYFGGGDRDLRVVVVFALLGSIHRAFGSDASDPLTKMTS